MNEAGRVRTVSAGNLTLHSLRYGSNGIPHRPHTYRPATAKALQELTQATEIAIRGRPRACPVLPSCRSDHTRSQRNLLGRPNMRFLCPLLLLSIIASPAPADGKKAVRPPKDRP